MFQPYVRHIDLKLDKLFHIARSLYNLMYQPEDTGILLHPAALRCIAWDMLEHRLSNHNSYVCH